MNKLMHPEGEAGGGAAEAVTTEQPNFDRLVEPEGTDPSMQIPSGEGVKIDGQNIEPVVQLPAKPVQTIAPKPVEKTPEQVATDKANLPFYKEFYNKLIESVDTPKDFKPAELTEDNYLDEIAKMMYDNMDLSGAMHPSVQRLQQLVEAHQGNFDMALKDFSTASSWKNLSDEQIVEWDLVQNLKVPQERAKELMSKMNLEVEALKLRRDISGHEEKILNQRDQQLRELRDQETLQERTEFQKNLGEQVVKLKEKAEYCGIQADAKQRQEFPDIFKHYVTPGEDGVPPIAKLLTDNDFLSDVVFLGHYRSKALKDFMDTEKNKIKQIYKDRLDPEPRHTEKSVTHFSQEIDLDRLTQPEGSY
jgi:hypothetical protein